MPALAPCSRTFPARRSPCRRPFPVPQLTGVAQFHPAQGRPELGPTKTPGMQPALRQEKLLATGGSGCTQHPQLRGKVQITEPQTPQGPTGCAKHHPYPTLSPQGHGICTHMSVVHTPGYPRLPFWSGFTWFCRQRCALVPAQCLAGHPRVSPASKGQEPHPGVSSFMCLTPGLLQATGKAQLALASRR